MIYDFCMVSILLRLDPVLARLQLQQLGVSRVTLAAMVSVEDVPTYLNANYTRVLRLSHTRVLVPAMCFSF